MYINKEYLPKILKIAIGLVAKKDEPAFLAVLISYASQVLTDVPVKCNGITTTVNASMPLNLIDLEGVNGKYFTSLGKEVVFEYLQRIDNVSILQPNVPIQNNVFVAKLEKRASFRLGLQEMKKLWAYKEIIDYCQREFGLWRNDLSKNGIKPVLIGSDFDTNNPAFKLALVFNLLRFEGNAEKGDFSIDFHHANLLFTEPLNSLTIE